MLAQAAPPGKGGDVPQVGPAFEGLLHRVRAVGEHRRINVGAHEPLGTGPRHDVLHVAGKRNLLEIALRPEQILVGDGEDHDVPGVGFGVDHRLDLTDRLMGRRHLNDLDPGLLGEGLVEAFLPGLGPRPAGIAHDERTRGPGAVYIDVRQREREPQSRRGPRGEKNPSYPFLCHRVPPGVASVRHLPAAGLARDTTRLRQFAYHSAPSVRRLAGPGPAALELKWMRIAKR